MGRQTHTRGGDDIINKLLVELQNKLEAFLREEVTAADVYEPALQIVVHSSFDLLPEDVAEAVHICFDLHDENRSWTPTREELKEALEILGTSS